MELDLALRGPDEILGRDVPVFASLQFTFDADGPEIAWERSGLRREFWREKVRTRMPGLDGEQRPDGNGVVPPKVPQPLQQQRATELTQGRCAHAPDLSVSRHADPGLDPDAEMRGS